MLKIEGARQKLTRAKAHLEDARSIFEGWISLGSVERYYVVHPYLSMSTHRVRFTSLPPTDFFLTTGDFLSNARAALDYAAWEIFLALGGSPVHSKASNVYFPVQVKATGFTNTIKNCIPGAGPFLQEFFRGQQDPVDAREPLLRSLHQLTNSQKHRSLHVSGLVNPVSRDLKIPKCPAGYSPGWRLYPLPQQFKRNVDYDLITYDIHRIDTPGMPASRSPDTHFAEPVFPNLELAITDGQTFLSCNSLDALLDHVSGILDAVEALETVE